MPRFASMPRQKKSALRWVCVMALSTIPLACQAASFDCAKAASPSEKTICATPELSNLDSQLAVAWKNAVATSPNAAALKSAQLQWLRQRNACGQDAACLGDRYKERIAALTGTPLASNRWDQQWDLDSSNPTVGGTLTFTGTAPHLHFTISGINGANTGAGEGDVVLAGNTASYRDSQGCKLRFVRSGQSIVVTEESGPETCGEGQGVSFGGKYITSSATNAKPSSDLVSLKVLGNRQENDAARALLGADYDALISTINISNAAPDLDHVGAKVQQFFVRGLATTNASIVMNHGDQLWVGLLVFDAHNQVRMRYYTNVAAWKKSVPKTILAWRDGIDHALPIDMMR